jgi:hypothetical protein
MRTLRQSQGCSPKVVRIYLPAMVLLLFAYSHSGYADTRMVFPRINFQNGLFSGIAVSNPTGSQASIKLTAYNQDGTKFAGSGVTNEVTASVPAGGQYLALASQVFNPPASILTSPTSTYLWMEVTSTTDGLTGFYLEGDSAITFQYGGDLGTSGTDLYLPAVENAGTTVTEISLVNADTSSMGAPANVTIDFVKADGTKAADSRSVTIPKAGAIQGSLSSIPGFNIAYDQVVALRIHSDRPVFCYGIVRPGAGKTPVALPAEDVTTPAKTLYFPQLAQGGGWTTGIGVANLNFSARTLVNITAYDPNGDLYVDPGIINPVSKQIPPGGFLRSSFTDLFPFSDTSYKQGWIKVEADTPAINGFVEYGSGGNSALVIAQLNSYQLSMFSHQAQADPYFTGLAVLNPGTLVANVEVFSLDNQGNTWGRTQTVLKPGQRISQRLFQLVTGSTGKTGGSVFVRSDRPVIATELFARNDLTALANVPPQRVTTTFDPSGPPKISPVPSLAVVEAGKTVQFTAEGSPGVQWTVNGSSGNSTVGTISASGLYTAPGLAPGHRTLTIQATSGNSSGGSSLDIVQREQVTGGLTIVNAVAYLDSLRRYFVAEQQILAGSPKGRNAATSSNTRISGFDAPNAPASFTFPIANDTIAKMLPVVEGGNSYLILAGRDSGKVYRLDVVGKTLATVISGLDRPNSLAFDAITGDLLVAESGAGRITVVPRARIFQASSPAGAPLAGSGRVLTVSVPGIQGVAVDNCTGAVYATQSDGTLLELQGNSQVPVVESLNSPGQLLPLYRQGLSCEVTLSLAVVEANRVSLVFPKMPLPRTTLVDNLQNVSDITFFPQGNPFTTGGYASLGLAVSSAAQGLGEITNIRLDDLYTLLPPVAAAAAALFTGTGPNQDPVADTFDFGLASRLGYSVPDIISVTGSVQAGSSVITVKFRDPVTPGSLSPLGIPTGDGLWAILFAKTTSGLTIPLPPGIDLSSYFPFGDPGLYIFDTYIEFYFGEASYVSLNQLTAGSLGVSVIGNTLTFSVPSSALNLSGARAVVLVGNQLGFTDAAPNNGLLKLAP